MLNHMRERGQTVLHYGAIFIFLVISTCCPAESTGIAGTEKTEIFNPYNEYLAQDKLLNEAYKALLPSLNKQNAGLLKQAQRKWITWRDQTCISAQTRVNRSLGAMGSSVRDDCLTVLTEQRTTELQGFLKEPKVAAKQRYEFSRQNDYSITKETTKK